MNEAVLKVGYGRFGKKGQLGYGIRPGEADSPITFNGQRYQQAISAAAPSSVKYKLGGQMKLFKASVACNDLDPGVTGPAQPMTFKVYGDGELLWASAPVPLVGFNQDVRISVAGVKELELRVDCASVNNARAVWLDPQVLK
jgi:alpha-galactosidase